MISQIQNIHLLYSQGWRHLNWWIRAHSNDRNNGTVSNTLTWFPFGWYNSIPATNMSNRPLSKPLCRFNTVFFRDKSASVLVNTQVFEDADSQLAQLRDKKKYSWWWKIGSLCFQNCTNSMRFDVQNEHRALKVSSGRRSYLQWALKVVS